MGDRDLPSDSDSSDEDFVPEGVEKEPVSEDESGGDDSDEAQEASEGENDVDIKKKRKKTPSRKRSRKKMKSQEDESHDESKKEQKVELSAEDRKQKADALWADFMKDCDPPVKKKTEISKAEPETLEKTKEQQPADTKMVQEFEFAGEKVLIEKKVTSTNGALNSNGGQPSTPLPSRGRGRGRGGATAGIASILGQIGKKNKLSTLEKSKLDWDSFKKREGIEEEIEQHNKGKNGYLERQDFLERADLRQFEIEKSLRAAKRSSLR